MQNPLEVEDTLWSVLVLLPKNENPLEVEDILWSVLVSLPKRTLMQAKLVSHEWKDLVCSNDFVRDYDIKSKGLDGFFYSTLDNVKYIQIDSRTLPVLSPPSSHAFDIEVPNEETVTILSSSKGLLAMSSLNFFWKEGVLQFQDLYVLYNPMVAEYLPLPPSLEEEDNRFSKVYGLAYDYSATPPTLLFMIVHFMNDGTGDQLLIHQFSSENSYWTRISVGLGDLLLGDKRLSLEDNSILIGSSTFLSGCLYWATRGSLILKYSVKKKEFSFMEGPARGIKVGSMGLGVFLGEWRGKLNYICCQFDCKHSTIKMLKWWAHDYQRGKWFELFEIADLHLPARSDFYCWPLVAIEIDLVEDGVLYLHLDREMYTCKLASREFRKINNRDTSIISSELGTDYYSLFFPYELPTFTWNEFSNFPGIPKPIDWNYLKRTFEVVSSSIEALREFVRSLIDGHGVDTYLDYRSTTFLHMSTFPIIPFTTDVQGPALIQHMSANQFPVHPPNDLYQYALDFIASATNNLEITMIPLPIIPIDSAGHNVQVQGNHLNTLVHNHHALGAPSLLEDEDDSDVEMLDMHGNKHS